MDHEKEQPWLKNYNNDKNTKSAMGQQLEA
jgi:hypothetical protein